jgi:hypothetical protein
MSHVIVDNSRASGGCSQGLVIACGIECRRPEGVSTTTHDGGRETANSHGWVRGEIAGSLVRRARFLAPAPLPSGQSAVFLDFALE